MWIILAVFQIWILIGLYLLNLKLSVLQQKFERLQQKFNDLDKYTNGIMDILKDFLNKRK